MYSQKLSKIAIGGDFPISKQPSSNKNSLDYNAENTVFFKSGRDAIRSIISRQRCTHIYVSAFSCKAVFDSLSRDGIVKITKIDIDDTFFPNLKLLDHNFNSHTADHSGKVFFLGNLWGLPYPPSLLQSLQIFKNAGGIVIEDITHSMDIGSSFIANGWVCSNRKWFGTSGLGSSSLLNFDESEILNQQYFHTIYSLRTILLKILGVTPKQNVLRKALIEILRNTDSRLGLFELVSYASKFDVNNFNRLNWENTFEVRRQNKLRMEKSLQSIAGLKIANHWMLNNSLFPTTVLVDSDQGKLRGYLKRNNIFAANLWPIDVLPSGENFHAVELSSRVLTLPTDHRYGFAEVDYIGEKVFRYFDETI